MSFKVFLLLPLTNIIQSKTILPGHRRKSAKPQEEEIEETKKILTQESWEFLGRHPALFLGNAPRNPNF